MIQARKNLKKKKLPKEKPVPVPLCPPQIPQRLDWD